LNYLSNKKGFLGLDNKFNFKEKVVIVPFGLEKTVSYGGGTKMGLKKLLKHHTKLSFMMKNLIASLIKKLELKH
jgi:agmatinase